jgi:DNA-binding SARP family transcriptional activator
MDRVYGAAVPRSRLEMPRAAGLTRTRLLTALDGVHTTGLALVVAPAGHGKTTLLGQWAATVPGQVAWYRADPADAEPGRLLRRLGAALHRRWGTEDPGTPPDADDLALAVERAAPLVLVIDDLHVLSGTGAEADLERFVVLAAPHLRVVLGTRRMPTFNLARSELPAPLTIGTSDLRFRSWEVERLFRDEYAAPLRPDDAATLAVRTEGWPAALRLFHLATQHGSPAERRRAIRALTGPSRYARDYLRGQVLTELSEPVVAFLRHTSVFDVLSGERCDALLDRHDGRHTLAELDEQQALISSDDGGRTYRCHPVLRRHLEAELYEELGDAGTRRWYRRAADLLESTGAAAESLRARCRAEDWDGVRRLLRVRGPQLAGAGGADWTELLPRWIADRDPWVSLAEARSLLGDGQLDAADLLARQAEEEFTAPAGRDLSRAVVRHAATWLPGPRRPIVGWEEALRAATRSDPAAAAERARALIGPLPRLAEGIAHLLGGGRCRASVALRRCSDDLGIDARPSLAARLLLATFELLIEGQPGAAAAVEAVQLDAERRGLTWLARVAGGVVAAGRQDRELVAAVAADCDDRGDPWGAVLVLAARAIVALRLGRPSPPALEDLATRFRALDAGALEAWARSGHALAVVAAELPEAGLEARTAESFARSAAVPGALALAYAALAGSLPEDRAELIELAASTARSAGLGCRPWTWLEARPVAALPTRSLPTPRRRTGSPRVEVTCFGRFRLLVDGVEPDLSRVRPRARTALRLLALNAGRPVHRELLADALWGELDPAAAMHNLQVAISSLRGCLEPGRRGRDSRLLVRDGEAYVLTQGEGSTSDLRVFDQALDEASRRRLAGPLDAAVAALRRAVGLYRGDVLPEDGPAEWVASLRDHYRLRAAEAAATLAVLELERGDAAAAAAAASHSLHLEQWRDASWRTLIEAYRRAGDMAAAERARRSYDAVLSDLGVDPVVVRG